MHKKVLLSLCLSSALIVGCSVPGVYKLDIQQGNIITQDMVDQLRPGMTTRQVRFIMGTPMITDTFSPQRWDYVYSIEPGGQGRYQERLSVFFDENNQLSGLSGDYMPGLSKDEEILGQDYLDQD